MSANVAHPLFACTRCNARHPFEELSQGQQLCKECRGAYPIVKCTYCRTEFQQESKSNPICKKCEQNVKLYGRPAACEYCNIIAAFIGNKCQRCTNSEKKFGPPLACDQCKQRCAFDRKDPESKRKVDGKLLCWLCTLSYKRALAKAKQNDTSIRHTSISVHKSSHDRHRSSSKKPDGSRSHSSRDHRNPRDPANVIGNGSSASKKARLDSNGMGHLPGGASDKGHIDVNNSDHVVTVTQLKEQIENLRKQLGKKDQELIEKDKKIAELTATKQREAREWREKLTSNQKNHSEKIDTLQQKISGLQKQNNTLAKAGKKQYSSITPNDSPLLAT